MEFVSREADGRAIDEGGRRSRSDSPYRGRPRSRSPSYEPRRSPPPVSLPHQACSLPTSNINMMCNAC